MNTRLGKSFGLAFVVAVGILALMFALGTFNAQKAGAAASDVELRLSDRNLDTHVEVTVSYSETDAATGEDAIAITFANLTLGSSSDFEGEVEVTGPISETETYTYTIASNEAEADTTDQILTLDLPTDLDPDTTGNQVFIPGKYTVVVNAGDATTDIIKTSVRTDASGDDPAVTEFMATATVGGVASNKVRIFEYDADVLSNRNAGAGVSLTIGFDAPTGGIDAGDDVVIEMKSFQIPATIDADAVSIKDTTNTANAADVTVSGSKITVEIPDMDGDVAGTEELVAGAVTIRLRSRAGVMNPNMAGENYQITVMYEQAELYKQNPGPINATLKVAPESGVEGAELTVSGVGYSNGTATIYIVAGDDVPAAGSADTTPEDFKSVGSATVSDGSFKTSVTVGDKFGAGGNDLIARSSTGKWGAQDGFNLNGAISLPDSVTKGTNLTVKVSKWSAGTITRATINGEEMISIADGAVEAEFTDQLIKPDNTAEFKIRVGAKALLGEQTLILYTIDPEDDSERSSGTKNITVVGIELAVSPSVAVVGQEVTVTGTGFRTRDGDNPAQIKTLTVGGVNVLDQVTDKEIASGGRVVAAFDIPDHADLANADEYTISLSDGIRSGSATLTIPERTLAVSPLEGRIGTPIDLSGTGWPSGTGANLVGIYYDGTQLSTATSNSSGEWSATITVPDNANVGMTHKVAAKASVGIGTDNVTKDADHKTPDAVVTPSPAQAQRGDTITVSGENFHTFRPVKIEIGESDVTPSPAPTTDGDGSFTADVLVPGLSLGNKNLKVTVNNVPVVEFLEIVATPVSTTKYSADVFEPLATAGVLTVVWHFDNDTKDWSFYDPRPEVAAAVDLTMVSSGDNVWIQVTADMEFQGETLTTGWNNITLD